MLWSNALIPTQKETPGRRRGAEPRPAAAGGHDPPARCRDVYVSAAGTAGAAQGRAKIVREEMDAAGRPGTADAGDPPDRALGGVRAGSATMGDVLIKFDLGASATSASGRRMRRWSRTWPATFLTSYRQLPITVYQVQTKFRNEPRPRFGIVRTREFLMKDAYSFGARRRAARTAATTRCTRPIAGSSTAAACPTSPSRPRAGRSAATPRTSSWSPPPRARTC